ncbi:MAG: class I SAM-dependent RNA methyltransferase [Acidobacteria bacterium]|nr:class I SAM-dependent RNA methyltransferase [Acidobacteriota bacterium]
MRTRSPTSREAPHLHPGDVVEVAVEKGVYRGLGLARHEGQVVFVPRGLPGDRIRARIESVSRGYVRGGIETLLEGGPGRRPSPCPYVPRCGGCVYQELSYAEQLRLKEAILRETLVRAGVAWEGDLPVAGSPEMGWRMRCSFHAEQGEEDLRLGLHEEASHRVVDLERCLQISERMNRAMRDLLTGLRGRPGIARTVRGVDLAESLDGSRLVACLEGPVTAGEAAGLAALDRGAPGLTGLGAMAEGRGRRRFVLLSGEPHVHAEVRGLRLRSHVRSFFQANRFLLGRLVDEVVGHVDPGGPVLDLYAGVGLFAIPLGARGDRVVGLELNATAVEDAAHNARAHRLEHVRFRCADVLAGMAQCHVQPEERIVLDPPRTGAGPAVVDAVAARRPAAIVYVSCDPPTLARDLQRLRGLGYRADAVSALDLFPDTFHVETIVRLRPA